MEKINEKKSFMIYGGGLHLEEMTQLTPEPSMPTTATATVTPNLPAPGPNLILLNPAIVAHSIENRLVMPSSFKNLYE
jgi:hypothetical protein